MLLSTGQAGAVRDFELDRVLGLAGDFERAVHPAAGGTENIGARPSSSGEMRPRWPSAWVMARLASSILKELCL